MKNRKDAGLATIKVPVSTMSYLEKTASQIREINDAVKNNYVEKMFNEMPVKGQIESIDNGVTIFQDLHKLSVGKMNYERSMANAKHKRVLYQRME